MAELAIIADDLSGALDAAAPFAMRGIPTAVALDVAALPEALATGARIVGVSTHSREISADAARQAVAAALQALPVGMRLFKKIDSRLKGNIAAELDALDYTTGLVVPAIPAFGRWVRNGQLGGFGVSYPIDIATTLGAHAVRALIPDIEKQADIERALGSGFDLAIGARSLAEAMARAMAPGARAATPAFVGKAAYCVIGSTDPITLAQLRHLRDANPNILHIEAPNGVATPLRVSAGLTIIQATPGPVQAGGPEVAEALGATLEALAPAPGSLLVLSGGATAQAILSRLRIKVLTLLGEALPGLPVAEAGGLTVVTKSGGFGDPDCLSRLFAPYLSLGSPVHTHVG
ncbi:four-carbon acid sugar kinase family protein [Devosia sediminis]|uniref:Four-carbon acid sugar kinase family protein n=1 Tax=Devosia sediminis TaxID=2798801 RepID=A0A934IX16_9HYPH|nr:four-carbon acid sugar kinase family protein [Devosia sediminis]MBJ3784570.1 four-carbon acid sugar kinase family protein [Devosia sediminis]